MILFKTIKWKNFLSTGQHETELDFTKNRTNLIIGTNGAGKSTVLDALTFSLFGKPFRKINKPQLLNSINQQQCVVEVEFSIGQKQYKIINFVILCFIPINRFIPNRAFIKPCLHKTILVLVVPGLIVLLLCLVTNFRSDKF